MTTNPRKPAKQLSTAQRHTACSLAIVAVVLNACGGGGSQPPTGPSLPGGSLSAGTTLSFVSGETNQPVTGAAVTVAGRTYTTSVSGEIALATEVPLQSSLAVAAPGFLNRQTLLRSATTTRFTLWPRTSPTGLTEQTTEAIVYTQSLCPFDPSKRGQASLLRLVPGTTQVFAIPSAEITADPAGAAGVERGVAVMNAATHGAVAYSLAQQAPAGSVSFALVVDPGNRQCAGLAVGATTFRQLSDVGITGGQITFCAAVWPRNYLLVAHELGHSFGLEHSPDVSDMMFCSGSPSLSFAPREQLLMALLLQRPQGNRFPDDDHQVLGTASWQTRSVISCSFSGEENPH